MKLMCLIILSFLSLSSFAFEDHGFSEEPNIACTGINQYYQSVEVYVYIGKKINTEYSKAKLDIYVNKRKDRPEEHYEVLGSITNERDLIGSKLFKDNQDTMRFVTTGYIFDSNNYGLRLSLKCDI